MYLMYITSDSVEPSVVYKISNTLFKFNSRSPFVLLHHRPYLPQLQLKTADTLEGPAELKT